VRSRLWVVTTPRWDGDEYWSAEEWTKGAYGAGVANSGPVGAVAWAFIGAPAGYAFGSGGTNSGRDCQQDTERSRRLEQD
jgi:hypothetical protein